LESLYFSNNQEISCTEYSKFEMYWTGLTNDIDVSKRVLNYNPVHYFGNKPFQFPFGFIKPLKAIKYKQVTHKGYDCLIVYGFYNVCFFSFLAATVFVKSLHRS